MDEKHSKSKDKNDATQLTTPPTPSTRVLRNSTVAQRVAAPSSHLGKRKRGGDAKGRSDAFDISSEFGTVARRDVDQTQKNKWDFITLRVRQVPLEPHSDKTNIFGDNTPRAKWDKAIKAVKQNAITYFQEQLGDTQEVQDIISAFSTKLGNSIAIALDQIEEDELDNAEDNEDENVTKKSLTLEIDEALQKADSYVSAEITKYQSSKNLIEKLTAKEKEFEERFGLNSKEARSMHLLINYLQMPTHASNWKQNEWLHTIADSLGGPVADWNGASGSYAANTQMAAIENLIKQQPGIGVEVKAYNRPEQRIAQWYEYTIIAHDTSGNPVRKVTFEIDAQRTQYSLESLTRDQEIVKEFLKETALIRNANDKTQTNAMPKFSLPEVVAISEGNKKTMKLEPGPLYAHPKDNSKPKPKAKSNTLTQYGNKKEAISIRSTTDNIKYKKYLELAEKYKANKDTYETKLAAIKSDTPEQLAAQFEKDNTKDNVKPFHSMFYDSDDEQLAAADIDEDSDTDELEDDAEKTYINNGSSKRQKISPSVDKVQDVLKVEDKQNALVSSLNNNLGKTKAFDLPKKRLFSASDSTMNDVNTSQPLKKKIISSVVKSTDLHLPLNDDSSMKDVLSKPHR